MRWFAKMVDGSDQAEEIVSEEKKYYALVKRVFHLLAPIYDAATFFISGLRNRVVDFTNADKESLILDACTGTGKQAFAYAKRGYQTIGVDLSKDMIKVAHKKNKFETASFGIADVTNLPFEDDCFDVSCVSLALHDMFWTIREKAVRDIVRVTKPKGTIIVVDYALPENRIRRFFTYRFVRIYEGEYYSTFIKSDFEALLRKSGIEIEEETRPVLGAVRIIKGLKA